MTKDSRTEFAKSLHAVVVVLAWLASGALWAVSLFYLPITWDWLIAGDEGSGMVFGIASHTILGMSSPPLALWLLTLPRGGVASAAGFIPALWSLYIIYEIVFA